MIPSTCPQCRTAVDARKPSAGSFRPFSDIKRSIRHGRGYGLHAEVLQYPLPPNCDCRHVTRTDKLGVVQACVSDLVCGTKQPDFVLSGTLRTPRNARQTREASHLEQCRRTWGSLRRSICNTAEGDCEHRYFMTRYQVLMTMQQASEDYGRTQ